MVDGASDKEEVVDKNLFVYMSKVRPEVPIKPRPQPSTQPRALDPA